MYLNSNQLRVFYYVARFKSISLASKELMVTPPAVSRQIKALEELLDLQLIYRVGNSMELTEAGFEIFQRSRQVFERLEDLESFIEDFSGLRTGTIRFGSPQSMSKYVMPSWIEMFKNDYPGIKVVLNTGSSQELIKSVIDRKNEIAIIGFVPDQTQMEKIAHIDSPDSAPLALVCSSSYPINDKIHIKELGDEPLIISQEGSAARANVLAYFKRYNVTPKIFLESSSVEVTKELVMQGKGLCFLTYIEANKELKDGTLRSINIHEGFPKIRRVIIFQKNKPLSPGAKAFVKVIESNIDVEKATFDFWQG